MSSTSSPDRQHRTYATKCPEYELNLTVVVDGPIASDKKVLNRLMLIGNTLIEGALIKSLEATTQDTSIGESFNDINLRFQLDLDGNSVTITVDATTAETIDKREIYNLIYKNLVPALSDIAFDASLPPKPIGNDNLSAMLGKLGKTAMSALFGNPDASTSPFKITDLPHDCGDPNCPIHGNGDLSSAIGNLFGNPLLPPSGNNIPPENVIEIDLGNFGGRR